MPSRSWAAAAVLTLLAVVSAGAFLPDRPDAPRELTRHLLVGPAPAEGQVTAAPLFASRGIVPGHAVHRCVVVDAGVDDGRVVVSAEDVHGPLAPHLRVQVSAGTGSAADCSDFTGTVVLDGPLDDLGRPAGGASEERTATDPGDRTFRVSVVVADVPDAAGLSASAALVWTLEPAGPGEPAPPPTTGPTAPPPSGPTPSPTAEPTGTPTPPPSAPPPSPDVPTDPSPPDGAPADDEASPDTTVVTAPLPGTSGPAPGTDGRDGPGPGVAAPPGGGTDAPARAGGPRTSDGAPVVDGGAPRDPLLAMLLGLARSSPIVLLLFLLVLLYLAVQDRIDRNDPKLALAPIHPDPDVPFPPAQTRSHP